jgi:hypothetical protein
MEKKVFIGVFIFLMIFAFFYQKVKVSQISVAPSSTQTENEKPVIVSIVPSGLSNNLPISPTQEIEITFNIPLENTGEFKYKITPPIELNLSLSPERKTIKLSPKDTFKLGTSYELEIQPGSKFNADPSQKSSQRILEETIFLRFKTIEYRGV